jgi:hypothetical protein
MPSGSAQRARRATALSIACAALLFAACSSDSTGGESAVVPDSTTPASNGPVSVTLAWGEAEGPVAGYSVYVQRDGIGGFDHEQDVAGPQVELEGEPGQVARVVVAAFDASRVRGPSSPPSPPFRFPSEQAASTGAPSSDSAGAASAAPNAEDSDTGDDGAADASVSIAGALVWQAGSDLRVTDAALETTLQLVRPAGSALAAVSDFDADGLADLLWVGAATEAGATVGFSPSTSLREGETASVVELGVLGDGERVLGAGDFDADGHADVLVASAAGVSAWLVGPDAAQDVSELGPSGGASFVGVGDFDASGTDDVAWRMPEGALVLWLMDAGQAHSSIEVALGPGLDAIASGDFDGDGAAELTLRDAQGEVYRLRPLALPTALDATDLAGALDWMPVGSVDLDRDGSDELVLASAQAIRIGGMPGDDLLALDPADSDWQLVALIP